MKSSNEKVRSLKYRVELVSHKANSLAEKTFCFYCGCFQGGNGQSNPTGGGK